MADLMIHQLTTERLPAQVSGNEWIAIDVIDPTQPLGYKTMKIKISSLPQGGGGGNTYGLIDNGNNTFQLVENGVPILPVISKGGGGGGATLFYSVTKAQLDTLISSNTLVEGATYWINDRGDVGLFFKAVSTNWLDFENGYRIMRVPIDYNVISVGANTMHGIWQNTLSVVSGDYVIWGGKVWENLNGNIGAENDQFTLDSEWQLVAKTDNNVYVNFGLGCNYDYDNDWIAYCWDKRGNRLGLSYLMAQDYGYIESTTNFCDWNNDLIISQNNMCAYMCNNVYPLEMIIENKLFGGIYSNANDYGIYFNDVFEDIGNNSCDEISLNKCTGSIHENSNGGAIRENICIDINGNNCSGSISKNIIPGSISQNINNGVIENNSNNGVILGNQPNVTDIKNNSNNGTIDNNNNVGTIDNNSNSGFISANENGGNIEKNRNNGTILGNGADVGNIYKNINNGDINNNDNAGHIQMNSNNGAIVNASNSVLTIENNNNNGIIDGTSLSGNITDPIVDKI